MPCLLLHHIRSHVYRRLRPSSVRSRASITLSAWCCLFLVSQPRHFESTLLPSASSSSIYFVCLGHLHVAIGCGTVLPLLFLSFTCLLLPLFFVSFQTPSVCFTALISMFTIADLRCATAPAIGSRVSPPAASHDLSTRARSWMGGEWPYHHFACATPLRSLSQMGLGPVFCNNSIYSTACLALPATLAGREDQKSQETTPLS